MKRGRENRYLPHFDKSHDAPGVYVISMPEVSRLLYIGSAALTIRHRWRQHISDLLANRHGNRLLQRAVNKYGLDKLHFEIVEICASEKALEREQEWINKHDWDDLFNLNPSSSSRLGAKLTEADRLRLAERHGGVSSIKVLRQIAKEYKAGASHGALAKKHGVDRSSIRNYLLRLGVKMRPFASANGAVVAKLKRLYTHGYSSTYCANQLNIDQATALRILRREGIVRDVKQAAEQRARNTDRKEYARAAGACIHSFSHPVHGKFRGYQFELRSAFGLNETMISQLCMGFITEVSGWRLISRPKKSEAIARYGRVYRFTHPQYGDFIGRQRDLLESFEGLSQTSISAVALGKRVSHRGWELKQGEGKHVFRGGSTKTRSGLQRKYRRKIPESLHARIRCAANKGITLGKLAKSYGVSSSCIARICSKERPKVGRKKTSKELWTMIMADLESGLTQAVVAEKYGFHQATISKLIKRKRWGC